MDLQDVDLFPEPVEALRQKRDLLRDRLREERAEVERYKALRKELGAELDGLITRCVDDAGMTASLIRDYQSAIRRVG